MFGDCYFRPFVHYLSVAADMSDLSNTLDWCEAPADECEQMSANAHAAWRILFDLGSQVERRKEMFAVYNFWFDF
jgi:hypothetical protein